MRPVILLTNDDGIGSAGLWAAAEALVPLGDVWVVAPDRQWSGAGRSMPYQVTGHFSPSLRNVGGTWIPAYEVNASPALAVEHAVLELVPHTIDLVVSGINAGANVSCDVTISGTVGAALEAAAFGIPALAISLEMDPHYHLSDRPPVSYATAQVYLARFAQMLLASGMPEGVDVLNINIPSTATHETPWRYTRLSRRRYFEPLPPQRHRGAARPGYRLIQDPQNTEPDSDLWTLLVAREISVTPLTLDLTAPVLVSTLDWMTLKPQRCSTEVAAMHE